MYNYYIGCVIYSNHLAMGDTKTVNLHKEHVWLGAQSESNPIFSDDELGKNECFVVR